MRRESQCPRFKVVSTAAPTAPAIGTCFSQGIALDWPGAQCQSTIDDCALLALHFNEAGSLTCIEVMKPLPQMMKGEVLPSSCPLESGVLQILNRLESDENFSATITLDEGRNLCQIQLLLKKECRAIDYGPATLELSGEGDLSRIVIKLADVSWKTVS